MRAASLLVVSAISVGLQSAQADGYPGRRSGLWESASVMSSGLSSSSKARERVDQEKDKNILERAQDSGASKCVFGAPKRNGDTYEASGSCSMAGSTVSLKAVVSGDLTNSMKSVVTTTFEPPLFGQKGSTVTTTAKYVGACPEGMKPGDIVLDNGMRVSREAAEESVHAAQEMLSNPEVMNAMKQALKNQGR